MAEDAGALPAERLGRYRLIAMLGRGGFATVYRARDDALGREVALKLLLPAHATDPTMRERFLSEARTLARLRHPGIVLVHDVGSVPTPYGALPYFAMELIEGETLAERLTSAAAAATGTSTGTGTGAGLPLAEVQRLVAALAQALDYLHAAGLVHRDVKAANVMAERGPRGRVVLMDLGIARAIDATAYTATGALLGTPEAIAPEQVQGQPAGPAADIYALGVLTFQLLSGRPPFVGDTARLLYAHAHEPPPAVATLRPDLPAAVGAAVAAALAKTPAQRPASAGAFAAWLAGSPPAPGGGGAIAAGIVGAGSRAAAGVGVGRDATAGAPLSAMVSPLAGGAESQLPPLYPAAGAVVRGRRLVLAVTLAVAVLAVGALGIAGLTLVRRGGAGGGSDSVAAANSGGGGGDGTTTAEPVISDLVVLDEAFGP